VSQRAAAVPVSRSWWSSAPRAGRALCAAPGLRIAMPIWAP